MFISNPAQILDKTKYYASVESRTRDEAKFISLAINSLSCTVELSKNIIPARQAAGHRLSENNGCADLLPSPRGEKNLNLDRFVLIDAPLASQLKLIQLGESLAPLLEILGHLRMHKLILISKKFFHSYAKISKLRRTSTSGVSQLLIENLSKFALSRNSANKRRLCRRFVKFLSRDEGEHLPNSEILDDHQILSGVTTVNNSEVPEYYDRNKIYVGNLLRYCREIVRRIIQRLLFIFYDIPTEIGQPASFQYTASMLINMISLSSLAHFLSSNFVRQSSIETRTLFQWRTLKTDFEKAEVLIRLFFLYVCYLIIPLITN